MGTVPTGRLEREMRKFYLSWVEDLPEHTSTPEELEQYVATFKEDMTNLIESLGGEISRMGIDADFPAPKMLDLRLHEGTVYREIDKAVIRAGISIGLNARDTAVALMKTSVGREYYKVERLARTETVNAYWKNQWAEAKGLDLVMLWSAERGPRTCEECLSKDGLVVADESIRDHPNGRCTLLPMLPDKVKYKGTLQADGSVTHDKNWMEPYKPKPVPEPEPEVAVPAPKYVPEVDSNKPPKWAKKKTPKYAIDDLSQMSASGLTEDDMNVLTEYTGSGAFIPINASLRGIDMSTLTEGVSDLFDDEIDEGWVQMFTGDLDKLIHKQTTMTDFTLYRGVHSGAIGDIKKGMTITDNGYMSTSADPKVAMEFMHQTEGTVFKITYPAGRPALYVDGIEDINLGQSEVILPRGTEMKVTNVTMEGGFRVVTLRA